MLKMPPCEAVSPMGDVRNAERTQVDMGKARLLDSVSLPTLRLAPFMEYGDIRQYRYRVNRLYSRWRAGDRKATLPASVCCRACLGTVRPCQQCVTEVLNWSGRLDMFMPKEVAAIPIRWADSFEELVR